MKPSRQADADSGTATLAMTIPDPRSPAQAATSASPGAPGAGQGAGASTAGPGAGGSAGAASLRPSVLQLSIRDKAALYSAYMSHVARGGLFVPTTRAARLGDDVFAIVSLPDDPAKLPIPGKVCWITPSGVPGRPQGIGIQFAANDAGQQARLRIEKILGSALGSDRPTSTL